MFDYETPFPVSAPQSVIDGYRQIVDEAASFVARFIDSQLPYQEHYPAPLLQFDGKRSVRFRPSNTHCVSKNAPNLKRYSSKL